MPGAAFPRVLHSEKSSTFQLASHVRVRRVGAQVILLDLLSNRYVAFGGPALHHLAATIAGWPAPDPSVPLEQPVTGPRGVDRLLANRWVENVTTRRRSGALRAISLVPASENLSMRPNAGTMRFGDLLAGGRSSTAAGVNLRCRSLLSIASGLQARRDDSAPPAGAAHQQAVVEATGDYLRWRPFLYSARDRCLHDSISLVHFLAGRSLEAHCVVGVRTRPFAAHACAQCGRVVLNDQHERVRSYQPILVV